MPIRCTQPDAAGATLVMARTVLGCVDGRLDGARNRTSVVGLIRLLRGYAAHGLAGHLAERRPVSSLAALSSPPSGTTGVERLRSALAGAFDAAFGGVGYQDAVDEVEADLRRTLAVGMGEVDRGRTTAFLRVLVDLLGTPGRMAA